MVKILFYLYTNILLYKKRKFDEPGDVEESRNDENEPLPKLRKIENYWEIYSNFLLWLFTDNGGVDINRSLPDKTTFWNVWITSQKSSAVSSCDM